MSRFQQKPSSPRDSSPPPITGEEARRIVEGDAKLLVSKAQEVSQQLQMDEASRTQVRRLFGEVKRIEMMWPMVGEEASRRLILLKPRLAYQVARKRELRRLQQALEPLIDQVGSDKNRFQRFLEFFEAIVAYSR